MKRFLSVAVLVLIAPMLCAQTAPDAAELTALLKQFLDGASRNDADIHDRFWAEDLIYTGSSGRRISKADIMRDLRSAPAPKEGDPTTAYSAEDIRIQQYGDTAVVAFRLVGVEKGAKTRVSNYLNSGTFLKRNSKWQVVNWQATRMPRSEEESKKEVAVVESAFHQAMLAGDAKALESTLAEGFIWTSSDGKQMTRQQLLDQVRTGALKFSKVQTSNVNVSVYADTAVVQGDVSTQRAATPAGGSGDDKPRRSRYTMTFVNTAGEWRAVAMNTTAHIKI